MEKQLTCRDCPLRARYDKNPKSLLGRFWRWHIKFCPGWKLFMKSIDEAEKAEMVARYQLKAN
jgi:hypothetical protein